MVDRFHGLRHDAVIRGDDQDHDVGDLRAARAHGSKGLVAGGVEKGHHAARRLDVIGADMLRDPARLPRRHLRAPDIVEERGLAVIDVSHHGHHRRARQRFGRGMRIGLDEIGLRIVQLRRLGLVAHLLDHDHRGLLVEHLVDGGHGAELHQGLDDLGGLHRHAVSQLADGDGLGHRDLAHQRLGGLRERRFAAAALVPGAAAHMPASHAAAGVAAGLDLAPAHGVVAQHRGGLRLLRLLVGLRFRCLGRVQRGSSCRSGFGDFLVGLLLFGFPAFAFLLLAQLGGLQLRELLLATRFLFAQLQLANIDAWCGRRRRRSLRRDRGGRDLGRIALHEDAFLAHLDLHRAVLAGGIGLADLAGLLAGQRDLVLALDGAVRAAQVFQQPRLVLVAERVLGHALFHPGRAQLLEQHRGRHLQLARKLGDAGLRHVTRPPASWPASRPRSRPACPRTSARAPP